MGKQRNINEIDPNTDKIALIENVEKELMAKNIEMRHVLQRIEQLINVLNTPRVQSMSVPKILENCAADDVEDIDEHEHLSSNIPQLDGNVLNQNISTKEGNTWECKCCEFSTVFETEIQLQIHHDTSHDFIEYEECNLCYPWHVWT